MYFDSKMAYSNYHFAIQTIQTLNFMVVSALG